MEFQELLEKIDSKLDKVIEELTDIKIVQARHEENLKEHIRRSDLLEKAQEIIFEELNPIKEHVSQVQGGIKLIGILGGVVTFILGCLKLLGKL